MTSLGIFHSQLCQHITSQLPDHISLSVALPLIKKHFSSVYNSVIELDTISESLSPKELSDLQNQFGLILSKNLVLHDFFIRVGLEVSQLKPLPKTSTLSPLCPSSSLPSSLSSPSSLTTNSSPLVNQVKLEQNVLLPQQDALISASNIQCKQQEPSIIHLSQFPPAIYIDLCSSDDETAVIDDLDTKTMQNNKIKKEFVIKEENQFDVDNKCTSLFSQTNHLLVDDNYINFLTMYIDDDDEIPSLVTGDKSEMINTTAATTNIVADNSSNSNNAIDSASLSHSNHSDNTINKQTKPLPTIVCKEERLDNNNSSNNENNKNCDYNQQLNVIKLEPLQHTETDNVPTVVNVDPFTGLAYDDDEHDLDWHSENIVRNQSIIKMNTNPQITNFDVTEVVQMNTNPQVTNFDEDDDEFEESIAPQIQIQPQFQNSLYSRRPNKPTDNADINKLLVQQAIKPIDITKKQPNKRIRTKPTKKKNQSGSAVFQHAGHLLSGDTLPALPKNKKSLPQAEKKRQTLLDSAHAAMANTHAQRHSNWLAKMKQAAILGHEKERNLQVQAIKDQLSLVQFQQSHLDVENKKLSQTTNTADSQTIPSPLPRAESTTASSNTRFNNLVAQLQSVPIATATSEASPYDPTVANIQRIVQEEKRQRLIQKRQTFLQKIKKPSSKQAQLPSSLSGPPSILPATAPGAPVSFTSIFSEQRPITFPPVVEEPPLSSSPVLPLPSTTQPSTMQQSESRPYLPPQLQTITSPPQVPASFPLPVSTPVSTPAPTPTQPSSSEAYPSNIVNILTNRHMKFMQYLRAQGKRFRPSRKRPKHFLQNYNTDTQDTVQLSATYENNCMTLDDISKLVELRSREEADYEGVYCNSNDPLEVFYFDPVPRNQSVLAEDDKHRHEQSVNFIHNNSNIILKPHQMTIRRSQARLLRIVCREMVQLTNMFRQCTYPDSVHNNNTKVKEPVFWDSRLAEIAYPHSKDMGQGRVPFEHVGFSKRHKAYPHPGSAGENLAWGSGYNLSVIARVAVDGWIDSPGHRKNLLGNWKWCGIGVFITCEGDFYATQLFAFYDTDRYN